MRTILIISAIILVAIVGAIVWLTRTPAPYSAAAAEKDLSRGVVRLYSYGLSAVQMANHTPTQRIDAVYAKYGFKEENLGCMVTDEQIQQISQYNSVVERYLNKRHGNGWRENFTRELFAALGVKHKDSTNVATSR